MKFPWTSGVSADAATSITAERASSSLPRAGWPPSLGLAPPRGVGPGSLAPARCWPAEALPRPLGSDPQTRRPTAVRARRCRGGARSEPQGLAPRAVPIPLALLAGLLALVPWAPPARSPMAGCFPLRARGLGPGCGSQGPVAAAVSWSRCSLGLTQEVSPGPQEPWALDGRQHSFWGADAGAEGCGSEAAAASKTFRSRAQ